jgi:hypothetical protein
LNAADFRVRRRLNGKRPFAEIGEAKPDRDVGRLRLSGLGFASTRPTVAG